jgi:hypothetical protein
MPRALPWKGRFTTTPEQPSDDWGQRSVSIERQKASGVRPLTSASLGRIMAADASSEDHERKVGR